MAKPTNPAPKPAPRESTGVVRFAIAAAMLWAPEHATFERVVLMPLMVCPDCMRQVSTEAVACPGCGRPLRTDPSSGRSQGLPWTSPYAERPKSPRSRGIYVILGLFFGMLGIHNFYVGRFARGGWQMASTLLLGWLFGLGLVITFVWLIVDLFSINTDGQGLELN